MLKKCLFWVVGAHGLLIASLLFSPVRKETPRSQKLAVHTEKLKPRAGGQVTAAAPKPKAVKKSAPASAKPKPQAKPAAPQTKPAPAKPAKKVVEQKKKGKPAPPPPQPTSSPPPLPQVEEVEEEAAPEIPKKSTSSQKLDLPSTIGPLHVDRKEGSFFSGVGALASYEEALTATLHQNLHLPEYGEVKIEVRLYPDGRVAKMVVLKTESIKNKVYLEREVPHLRFPPLVGKEEVFVITLCNEI